MLTPNYALKAGIDEAIQCVRMHGYTCYFPASAEGDANVRMVVCVCVCVCDPPPH